MSDTEQRRVDAIVVGGGIAGLTAATVLAEHGYAVTMIDEYCGGGRLLTMGVVKAYPALEPSIDGPDLAARCLDAALDAGVEAFPARVVGLEFDGMWLARTTDGTLRAPAVVLATGRTMDVATVPGAAEFVGRGLSHCASCDGPLFAGQSVAVVGTSWWLATEVGELAAMTDRVNVLLPAQGPPGPQGAWAQVAGLANVHVVTGARLVGVEGGSQGIATVVVERDGESEHVAARGLFLCDDVMPSVPEGLPADLLDETGAIQTVDGAATAMAGLFAAGDVRAGSVPYLVSAAADGVRAALAASAFLAASAAASTNG